MTLADFKLIIEAKNIGGVKLPKTEQYPLLLQESLEYIAKETKADGLKTEDMTETTLLLLSDTEQIRKPIAPTLDDDELDIDDLLSYAVVYDFLFRRATDADTKILNKELRDDEIGNYQWARYAYQPEE